MSDIEKLISKIQDCAVTLIDLPLKNGEYNRQTAILRKEESPAFSLVFPPDCLNIPHLDLEATCRLSVKHPEKPIAFLADINGWDEDTRTLHFVGKEPLRPELLREYFRVSLRVPIIASYEAAAGKLGHRSWTLCGETVDMSGGGVLANFPEAPLSNYHIRVEIKLPCGHDPLIAFATVVRTNQLRKKLCQVALHFEHIEPKIRDLIISTCLHEQRRQLRERIRTE